MLINEIMDELINLTNTLATVYYFVSMKISVGERSA